MISRRALLAGLPLVIAPRLAAGRAPARLALTFDYYPAVVTARDIMTTAGITTATYYAWYPNIVSSTPTGDQISTLDLALMKRLGWEIGGYTNDNMVAKIRKSRNDAYRFLRDLADGMDGKGFRADTIAPNQRAWNTSLADLARDWFKGVRVADVITEFQQYPIADPLYVRGGAANSWGYGTNEGSDSPAVILARIDNLISDGGLGVEVVHKVGSVGDPMTFTIPDFAAVMSGIASRVSTGRLQLVTMTQALTPP